MKVNSCHIPPRSLTLRSRVVSSLRSLPPLITTRGTRDRREWVTSGSKVRWTDRDTERYDPRVKRVNERPSVMSREWALSSLSPPFVILSVSFLVTHFPSFIPAGGTRSGTRSGTTKGMGDVERTEADKWKKRTTRRLAVLSTSPPFVSSLLLRVTSVAHASLHPFHVTKWDDEGGERP